MVNPRMPCTPVVCWVIPSAYRMAPGRFLAMVFRNLLNLGRRNAGDTLPHFGRVPRNERLKAHEDALRIIKARRDLRATAAVQLVPPSLCVVLVLLLIKSAEQPILEVECCVTQKERVGMGCNVVLVVQLVNENIVDHRVEKSCVGTWSDARVHVGRRGCSGEPRVDVDDGGPVLLGLPDPLVGHGVVLGHIAAFHQDRLAMLQVNPVVGHRPASKRCPQTGDRGAVSKSSLMFDESKAEKARRLLEQVTFFVGVLRAAHEGNCLGSVHRNFGIAECLSGDPGCIACLLDLLRDPLNRAFPRDLLPAVAAWRPIARGCKPVRGGVRRKHGYALNAQRTAIHDMVVITLHRNQLAVTHRRDHAASAGTEIARRRELIDFGKLKVFGARANGRQVN